MLRRGAEAHFGNWVKICGVALLGAVLGVLDRASANIAFVEAGLPPPTGDPDLDADLIERYEHYLWHDCGW